MRIDGLSDDTRLLLNCLLQVDPSKRPSIEDVLRMPPLSDAVVRVTRSLEFRQRQRAAWQRRSELGFAREQDVQRIVRKGIIDTFKAGGE